MTDMNLTQPGLSNISMDDAFGLNKAPDPDAELREVADQFEAIFLNEFLKQARKTKLAEDLFGSSAKSQYEELLDREYATSMSSNMNLGIAEALIRQFGSASKTGMK